MASTRRSTQAGPRFDDGIVAEETFTDIEQALAMLVHASDPPDARGRGPASDRSADGRISQSFAAGTLGAADLRPPISRAQRSLGKRGTLARVAIAVCLVASANAVCLVASAIWAWRSYGGPAPKQAAAPPVMSAPLAPKKYGDRISQEVSAPLETRALPSMPLSTSPPARAASQAASIVQPATTAANEPGAASAERQQVETSDLAALRQTVEQLAGQEQSAREIAKLQAEKPQADNPPAEKPDKRMLRRLSTHPAPPVAAPARKPAPITPMPPQAARRVSTVSARSRPPPAPQIPSETQPSNPPPLRPPMPMPQP
jgi:hypothetical protein